jgi:predicted nucleotidyltransferase
VEVQLRQQFGLSRIALFGSAARDELRADSDIDVLARRVIEIAESDRDDLSRRMEGRYRTLRFALIATLCGSLVLVTLSLYGALRATRD